MHAVDTVPTRHVGQWTMVWWRFRQHRAAFVGGITALAMIALALGGPLVAPTFVHPDRFGNLPLWAFHRANQPPRLQWPFVMGTDPIGNPVVTYILVGGRPILTIGVFGALLASILGMVIGGLAGYLGGIVDAFLMRLVDAFLAVPFLLLLILLSRYLTDRGVLMYVLIFGLAGWAGVARLVRSYVLSLREREYAVAARALGVSPWGIILRHLLPNALDVLVVSFTLNVAVFMVAEVTLDFLGAGTSATTWGTLLPAAFTGMLNGYWWLWVFPSLALLISVLAVNFLGDGLRDALDVTSSTALVTARPAREAEPGLVRKGVIALGRGMGQAGHALAVFTGRLDLPWQSSPGRVALSPSGISTRLVPGRVRELARAERPARYTSAPIAVRLGPIAAVFVAVGVVFLYGHAPLNYAPNYAPPTTYASVYGESEYAARRLRVGGWEVFDVDGRAHLAYQRFDAGGRLVLDREVAPGDSASEPAMARSAGHVLGAWVAGSGQVLEAAYLDRPRARTFRLTPAGGIVEHPFVVASSGGGFDVLFGWQRPGQSAFDIYAVLLGPMAGPARPLLLRLVRSDDYALYPRGIVDGSGALDVVYLERRDRDHGRWQVRFQRFTPAGRSLGRPIVLGTITYIRALPSGGFDANVQPAQWAIDLKRARDASVWVAWEDGDDTVVPRSISGSNTLYVAHWSPTGQTLLPRTVVDPAVDANAQAVALALQPSGGVVYHPQPGALESYLQAVSFDEQGQPGTPERVAYDGGGNAANPRAAVVAGRPAVLWQKIGAEAATLEGTTYHPAQPPDLLTHLGLNIGNLWGSIALLVFGALGGGIALAIVNTFLLLPLIPVWLVLRRLVSGFLRWPLYLAAIAVLLAWIFALPASLPGYVVALSGLVGPLGALYGWLAVAGGVFVSYWAGRFLLARRESTLRATVMAALALYFVMAMYALVYVESQLGRI